MLRNKISLKPQMPIFFAAVVILFSIPIIYSLISPILPTVMQDELVYRENARLGRTEPIEFPNYLYFRLYGLFDLFGDSFYQAAKFSNVLFHTASAFLVLFWKQSIAPSIRALSGLIYFFSPFLAFTSFYMPEPVYAFFVLISVALFMRGQEIKEKRILFSILTGFFVALAQLSKPHGLFILTGLVIFLAIQVFAKRNSWTDFLRQALAIVTSFAVARFVVGFALVGGQSLNFTGSYTSNTNELIAKLKIDSILGFAGGLPINLAQHLLVLSIYLAPVLYSWLTSKWIPDPAFVLLLVLLSVLAVFIAAFETYLTFIVGDNHQERVLLRHYEFLVPLVWLTFFQIHSQLPKEKSISPFSIAMTQFIFVLLFLTASLTEGALWQASKYSDSGLTGALSDAVARWSTVLIWLVIFALLTSRKRVQTQVVATLVLVATLVAGTRGLAAVRDDNLSLLPSDRAGIYVRENLGDFSGNEILVVGTDKALTQASIFQMNKAGVTYRIFAAGTALDPKDALGNVSVIVQLGELGILDIGQEVIEKDGFSISIFSGKRRK